MNVGDIKAVVDGKKGESIYKVANKILQDGESKGNLCSSIEDITKVQGICNSLSEKNNIRLSSSQKYVLVLFIAENLIHYGEIVDENTASEVFNNLVK